MKRMTLKKTLFAIALAGCTASAYAATVSNMTVSGGTFAMPGVTTGTVNWTNSGNSSANLVGGYNQFGTLFSFFGSNVKGFTGNGTTAPYGGTPVNGGAVPSFTTSGSTIGGNLSAWTVYWNGTNFNQGANPVSGGWNPTTGAYNISWTSHIVGGPFNGFTGDWSFAGTATAAGGTPIPSSGPSPSPVPEASTTAMMLAGITLLGALMTRRRRV